MQINFLYGNAAAILSGQRLQYITWEDIRRHQTEWYARRMKEAKSINEKLIISQIKPQS